MHDEMRVEYIINEYAWNKSLHAKYSVLGKCDNDVYDLRSFLSGTCVDIVCRENVQQLPHLFDLAIEWSRLGDRPDWGQVRAQCINLYVR